MSAAVWSCSSERCFPMRRRSGSPILRHRSVFSLDWLAGATLIGAVAPPSPARTVGGSGFRAHSNLSRRRRSSAGTGCWPSSRRLAPGGERRCSCRAMISCAAISTFLPKPRRSTAFSSGCCHGSARSSGRPGWRRLRKDRSQRGHLAKTWRWTHSSGPSSRQIPPDRRLLSSSRRHRENLVGGWSSTGRR